MAKELFADADVEREIARLTDSDLVKLARRELYLRNRRRQRMYTLRSLEKRGLELQAAGISIENLEALIAADEQDEITEKG